MPKIKVAQADGEITISHAGDEPTTYRVTDSHATVKEADVARFLSVVDGSSLVGGSPATKKEI